MTRHKVRKSEQSATDEDTTSQTVSELKPGEQKPGIDCDESAPLLPLCACGEEEEKGTGQEEGGLEKHSLADSAHTSLAVFLQGFEKRRRPL